MKRKPIIYLLGFLFIISTVCGVVGLIHKNKQDKEPKQPETVITYEYYVEGIKVDNKPNNSENEYIYSRYECDNEIVGSFDSEKWEFSINEASKDKNGTCKLYFVNAFYEVTLSATNGVVDETAETKIKREEDASFVITPNEGYEFKEVVCSNNKEATYDLSTNTLGINVIMEDVACKVSFELKNLKLDLSVKNGKGTTIEYANYGESISAIVEPNEGYEKPTITCTNDQEYTYSNNNFSIPKITNNTKCTVTFKKTPIVKYKITIKDISEKVRIVSGSTEQTVVAGKDGKFTLLADEGYDIELDCGGVQPSKTDLEADGSYSYTFLEVNKDITCNVNAKEKSQSNTD